MSNVVTYKEKQSLLSRYKHKAGLAVMGFVGSVMATPAFANGVDVSGLVTDITANKSGMETIALAVLGILAFIFGIKLLRRVLS